VPDPCTNTTSATADVNLTDTTEIRRVMTAWCGDSEVGDADTNRPGVAPSGTRLGGFVSSCGYDPVVAAGVPWPTTDSRTSPAVPANDVVAVASLDTEGISAEVGHRLHRCPKGHEVRVICTHCGRPRVIWESCGDRIRCHQCRLDWMRDTRRRFQPVLDAMAGSGGRIRFLTLTVNNGADLGERVEHLERSFRRLKQRVTWRRNVEGAIRVLEIAGSPGDWHPHFHILFTGNYIPQKEMADTWKEITGDSCIVDIRHAGSGVVKELFKYTVKDAGLLPDALDEIAAVLHNKNVVVVLGRFYRRQVAPPRRPSACPDCGANAWALEGVFYADVRYSMRC
jgi:hypothetical protein